MSDSRAGPISASERIATIDIVRGFALLGIFIMNMPAFNTSLFPGFDEALWPHWWDRGTETVRDVIFSGKFNSMFSMLFAVGFTIQLGRLQAARAATRDADLPAAAVLAVCVRHRACLRLLGWRRPAHVCGAWLAIARAAPAAGPCDRGLDRRVPVVSNDPRHDTDRDREAGRHPGHHRRHPASHHRGQRRVRSRQFSGHRRGAAPKR